MARGHRSIGEVLALLADEHPGLTVSKIRYLETKRLIAPERTPSGYRKFHEADVERLRWVLEQQREHYLPLKEIRRRLDEAPVPGAASAPPNDSPPDAGPRPEPDPPEPDSGPDQDPGPGPDQDTDQDTDSGPEPDPGPDQDTDQDQASSAEAEAPESGLSAAPVPSLFAARPAAGDGVSGSADAKEPAPPLDRSLTMTSDELARAADVDEALVGELVRMGLVAPVSTGSAAGGREQAFDHEALLMVKAVTAFAAHGVPARNLRMYKVAADREAGVYEQVVSALAARGERARARREVGRLIDLADTVRRCLLRRSLSPHLADRAGRLG